MFACSACSSFVYEIRNLIKIFPKKIQTKVTRDSTKQKIEWKPLIGLNWIDFRLWYHKVKMLAKSNVYNWTFFYKLNVSDLCWVQFFLFSLIDVWRSNHRFFPDWMEKSSKNDKCYSFQAKENWLKIQNKEKKETEAVVFFVIKWSCFTSRRQADSSENILKET